MRRTILILDQPVRDYRALIEALTRRFGRPLTEGSFQAVFHGPFETSIAVSRFLSAPPSGGEGSFPMPKQTVWMHFFVKGEPYAVPLPEKIEFVVADEEVKGLDDPLSLYFSPEEWKSFAMDFRVRLLDAAYPTPKNRKERREIQRYLGNEGRKALNKLLKNMQMVQGPYILPKA